MDIDKDTIIRIHEEEIENEEGERLLDINPVENPEYNFITDFFGGFPDIGYIYFWSVTDNCIYMFNKRYLFEGNKNNNEDIIEKVGKLPDKVIPVHGIYPAKEDNKILLLCNYFRRKDEYIPVIYTMDLNGNIYNTFFNYKVNHDEYSMLTIDGNVIEVENQIKIISWTMLINRGYLFIDFELGGTIFDFYEWDDNNGFISFTSGILSNFLPASSYIPELGITIASNYFHLNYFEFNLIPMVDFAIDLVPSSVLGISMSNINMNFVLVYNFSYLMTKYMSSNVVALGSKLMIPIMTLYRFSNSYEFSYIPSNFYTIYYNTKILPVVNNFSKLGFPLFIYDYMNDKMFIYYYDNNNITNVKLKYDNDKYVYIKKYEERDSFSYPKYLMCDEFWDFDYFVSLSVKIENVRAKKTDVDDKGIFPYNPIYSNSTRYYSPDNYIYCYLGYVNFFINVYNIKNFDIFDNDNENKNIYNDTDKVNIVFPISLKYIHTDEIVNYIRDICNGAIKLQSSIGYDITLELGNLIPLNISLGMNTIEDLKEYLNYKGNKIIYNNNEYSICSECKIPIIITAIEPDNITLLGKLLTGSSLNIAIPKELFNRIPTNVAYIYAKQNSVYNRYDYLYKSYIEDKEYKHYLLVYKLTVESIIKRSIDGLKIVEIKPKGIEYITKIDLGFSNITLITPIYTEIKELQNKESEEKETYYTFYINFGNKIKRIDINVNNKEVEEIKDILGLDKQINLISRYYGK